MTFSDVYKKKMSFRVGLKVAERLHGLVMIKILMLLTQQTGLQFRALGKAELADRISDRLRAGL